VWGTGEPEEGDLLIPVYIVGFILGGLLCFAIAQRVSNRPVKIAFQIVGVAAGPLFFLVVATFSSQERKKTYEMEWLTGKPAAEFYLQVYKDHVDAPDPETIVILRRNTANNRVCYSSLESKELAHYVESLSTHTVKVQYTVIYDFYRFRTFRLESVGDFPHGKMTMGSGGGGLTDPPHVYEPCFPW
jgi:hypothetical protein